jgi:hypothetical protein
VTVVTRVHCNCNRRAGCDTKDELAMRLATNREIRFADGLYRD